MANKQLIIDSPILNLEQKTMAFISYIGQELESYANKMLIPFKLSYIQFQILGTLMRSEEKMLTVNQIKEELIANNPNVSRSVNTLMANDLIKKQRSEKDQRVVHIKLTAKGEKVHQEATDILLKNAPKPRLNEAELRQLYQLLQKF